MIETNTRSDYFFFVLFSVLINGLLRMYAQFTQLSLMSSGSSVCLPKVYYRVTNKCDYNHLRRKSIHRLKVDLAETFVSKLFIPIVILCYKLLRRIWDESAFFAQQIAFKGTENMVQTLFFSFILFSINVLAGWPFTIYRQAKFQDQCESTSLYDSIIGDLLMKYPMSLNFPKYVFWVVAWSYARYSPIALEPSIWIIETAYLAITYEIIETLLEGCAFQMIPDCISNRNRCNLDLNVLKGYNTTESLPTAKIYIFRKVAALPMSLFNLPFTGDELMSVCVRYLGAIDGNCIMGWRVLERIQSAFLYYLIHSITPVEEIMKSIGLGMTHPIVLRWIIIDIFIYPILKTLFSCIRHYCNHQQEFMADRRVKPLGYDVALEAAIAKLGMHQERFPVESWIYELIFRRSPTAVQRMEELQKCPL